MLFRHVNPNQLPDPPTGESRLLVDNDGKLTVMDQDRRVQALGAVPGAGNWGDITGTLSDQTDLQTALDAKGNLAGGNTWAGLQTITPEVGGSAIVVAGVAQTTSRPVLDLAQTWNAGGVTFTGLRLNITDTASAADSMLLNLQVGGASRLSLTKIGSLLLRGTASGVLEYAGEAIYAMNTNATQRRAMLSEYGIRAAADVPIGFSNSTSGVGTQDVFLYRDAANTLAQRNGTAAQAFRVYNTWTDASNGEWGAMRWNSNVLEIGTFFNGTGTARSLLLATGGISRLNLDSTGATVPANSNFTWASRLNIYVPTDGNIVFTDSGFSSFGRLMFGGTSTSFPALKRSNAELQVRLANDSAFADMQARSVIENPPASLTLATNGQFGVEITSNTAGNLVYRGSDGTTRRMALTFS